MPSSTVVGDGVSAATGISPPLGIGSGSGGLPVSAAVMKSCQMRVGRLPPVTLFIGVLSSLPTQTPVTRSAVKPMNQASR